MEALLTLGVAAVLMLRVRTAIARALILVAVFLALPTAKVMGLAALHSMDVCTEGKWRILPDHEFFPPAVFFYLHIRYGMVPHHEVEGLPDYGAPYTSVDQFLALHPDCCRLTLTDGEGQVRRRGWLSRPMGYGRWFVHIRHKPPAGDPHPEIAEAYVMVSNCGMASFFD